MWLLLEERTTACEGTLPRGRGKDPNQVKPAELGPVHRRWGQKDVFHDTRRETPRSGQPGSSENLCEKGEGENPIFMIFTL